MPTIKQKRAAKKIMENHGSVSTTMIEVGYSPNSAKNPKNLTDSKGFQELMDKALSDEKLIEAHSRLLNSNSIDHMVFPLNVSDPEIEELMHTVNCVVKKFQHSEQATHIWFWSPDNKARKDALDMAYKLKGKYKPMGMEHSFKPFEITDEQKDILDNL